MQKQLRAITVVTCVAFLTSIQYIDKIGLHEFFRKKLRIGASSKCFLKLSDFEHSQFLTSFLKVFMTASMFTICGLVDTSKQDFRSFRSTFRVMC